MAIKAQLPEFQIITNGSMTGTTSITSAVTNISRLDDIGLQFHFTGTPTGTFAVQISADYGLDYLGNVTNAGHWVTVALSPSPAASGAAGDIYIDMATLSAPYVRVVYTNASGTGTLNAWITGKQI